MRCDEINSQVFRKDYDFYFLRDILVKLYPATIVSFYFNNDFIKVK